MGLRGNRSGRSRVLRLALAAGLVLASGSLAHAELFDFFRSAGPPQRPAPAALPAAAPAPARSAQPVKPAAAPAVRAPTAVAPVLQTMCVRLCDGYAFPLGTLRSSGDRAVHERGCEAACPHAPVRLFTMRAGGDLASARSVDGTTYRNLPKAFAYMSRRERDCSCQGPDRVARRLPIAQDQTLRRGDVFLDAAGALVFSGARLPASPRAFEDFRRSAALTRGERRQIDGFLTVAMREARREAMMNAAPAPADRPSGRGGFAEVAPPRGGFGAVRVVVASPFVSVN